MALPPGSRIGHYEIVAPLGEGGMGVVYRARDSKLKRDVAIKLLPADVSGNAERLARFQREAEMLAALNHPHIAQIYGIEDSGDQHAIVMEAVDGPTIADRINGTPMAIDEVIAIAQQLVDAIAFAHALHIIHRDLKPANIKLTGDGSVKVLDFGLAKAIDPQSAAGGSQADSPTITSPAMTRAGTFLGTAAYMAPEQARGVAVDKRADIWAFGVVLFEMLTGRRLFEGETVSDTLANVLKAEPDWSALPAGTPDGVRRLLRHCLARDRKLRLQDIGDARFDLEAAPVSQSVRNESAWRARGAALAAAAFAVGIAAAMIALPRLPSTEVRDQGTIQFQLTGAPGTVLEDPAVFAVAPNSRLLAFRAYEQGTLYWYLYSVESGTIRKLDDTRNATGFVFSPDSQWGAFTASAALSKIRFDAMRTEQVVPAGMMGLATAWLESGDILTSFNGQIHRVPAGGGGLKPLLSPKPGANDRFGAPTAIPGTNTFLTTNGVTGGILLGTLTGETRQLETGGTAAYAGGRLLSLRGSQLLTWPMDVEGQRVTGPPQVLIDKVLVRSGAAGRAFSVSQGLLAYRTDLGTGTQLTWFDRNGQPAGAIKMPLDCRNPELSPDGQKLAVECYEGATGTRDIWTYDLARGAATRFTTHPSDDSDPSWSPDGRQLAFTSNRNGPSDIFVNGAGGAAADQLLAETPGITPLMAWSPDGQVLALYDVATQDLVAYDLKSKATTPLLASPFQELELQFSPDGRFFSYASDESGRNEIYVQPWPPNGEKWQISTNGGNDARWRGDGKEIFYVSTARDLMSAPVDTTRDFKAGATARLFNTRIAGPIGLGHRFPYAVSRDGSRFLVYVNERTDVLPSITVVLNWPALLER